MIRAALSRLARAAIARAIPHLPEPRVIYDREGKSPYLSRWYLTGRPTHPDGGPAIVAGQLRPGVSPPPPVALYLHRFHRGDDDLALHNHPWRWALSLVLVGGYSEERRIEKKSRRLYELRTEGAPRRTNVRLSLGYEVLRREVPPLSWNLIKHDTFHRVELLEEGECWSLFLVGPKVSSWGFWDRDTGEFIPWREFITRLRGDRWQES